MEIRTKLINQHSKDCYAIKAFQAGDWCTPWAFIGEIVWRDIRGGKRGKTEMWQTISCNCTYCDAKLLINVHDILKALPPHNKPIQPTDKKRGGWSTRYHSKGCIMEYDYLRRIGQTRFDLLLSEIQTFVLENPLFANELCANVCNLTGNKSLLKDNQALHVDKNLPCDHDFIYVEGINRVCRKCLVGFRKWTPRYEDKAMKIINEKTCYCHTCKKDFHFFGIARHRAMHRKRKEYCKISYTNGDTYEYLYNKPVEPTKDSPSQNDS
jgi:hypothetical protein